MSVTTTIEKNTFAAGELDKALHARTDLAKFQTGVAACENMVVMVEGGLTRRSGTRFVVPLKNEAEIGQLVPFEYSVDDVYMLIVNASTMRVMRNGGVVETVPGVPYELTVPFTAADLPTLRWTESGNVLFVAWGRVSTDAISRRPKVITRNGHTAWTIADYVPEKGPVETQNLDVAKTITASAAIGTVTLTASAAIFQAGHVGSIWRLDEGNLAVVPGWLGNEAGLAFGNLRRNAGKVYSVAAGENAGPTAPTHDEGVVSAGQNKVTWQFVHDGSGYVQLTSVGADGTTAVANVLSQLPESCISPYTTYRWFEAAWSDVRGWPSNVQLQDNRLAWTRDDRLWLTKVADYYGFELSTDDDSAVATRLTSPDGKLVEIEWLLNSGVVVIGARNNEWMVRGTDPFSPITVTSIRAVPDGSEGSAPHRPQLVDGGAVFIGRSRKRLHYAEFDRIAEKISVDELTLFARHILKGNAIDLGYARDPHRIVWIGQATGELVGITFRPDQQVIGWHRHPMTNGVVENFGVLPSADAAVSDTWMIVRRQIDGQTRRYVEVLQPFFEPIDPDAPDATGAWFVDSGIAYSGPPVTRVTGADHLVAQEVAILADGREHKRATVDAAGGVDLDQPFSSLVLGLPIRWRVKSLRFDANLPGGSPSRGTMKQADSVYVERLYSAGGEVSVNGGPAEPLLLTGAATLGRPQPLATGGQWATTLSNAEEYLEVEISGDTVYPFTLTGLSPHVQFTEGA